MRIVIPPIYHMPFFTPPIASRETWPAHPNNFATVQALAWIAGSSPAMTE
jgi:hypothetical protein